MMESEMLYNLAAERSYPTPFANSPLLPLLLISLATQKRTPVTKIGFDKEYDFVIVGAGAAGSVLAARLSEVPFINVLLLEAGGDPPMLTEVPLDGKSYRNSDVDWNYITTPQKHTAARHINRQILYSAGKVIGGSTVINNHFAYRGNRKNFDDWAAQGAEGWSYEEVLPYFLKLEDYVAPYYEYVSPDYHASGGPLTVTRFDLNTILDENTTRIARAVRNTIVDLGYEEVDADGPTQTGYAKYQSGTRNGQVCSNAKAYLVGSENRGNLDIVKNARVIKVVIEDKRATGVIVDYAGFRYEVRARREVILSAGAISTPQLLMLSGIGPMSELLKFKIPVVADLPVGQNFQDIISAILPYYVEGSGPLADIFSSNSSILNYIYNRKGPLTLGFGCFAVANLNKENSQANLPDFTIFVSYADFKSTQREFLWSPEFIEKLNGPYEDRTALICASTLINPKSRGSVRLNSPNPYDLPIFDPNYLENFEDVETIVQGLKTCRRIMSSPEVQDLGIKPFETTFDGCEDFVGDEDLYLRCTVRTVIVMLNRFASTAKMGNPSDPTTVVDPQLRVKNVYGLRVVDGSVMPTVTWGFTKLAVTMIAEKASDLIKSTL